MSNIHTSYFAFQSTLPMRGGTAQGFQLMLDMGISIHPPHAGRDAMLISMVMQTGVFQSTLPMRGGTEDVLCEP